MARFENLTMEQKAAMFELRNRMENALTPGMDKDDLLFYRFLKARDFDIKKAESMLKKHIIFRKAVGVDTVLQDFTPKEAFLQHTRGCNIGEDKEGFPVVHVPVGRVEAKDVIKCFKLNDFVKHYVWNMEHTLAKTKEMNIKYGRKAGDPFSLTLLFDLDELQLSNVLNPKSIVILAKVVETLQDNYPEVLRSIYIINAPPYYVFAFNIIKKVLAAEVLRKLHIYGKTEFQHELLKVIDAEVLPAFLGGNRTDPDGDPKCKSLVIQPGRMPAKFYLTTDERFFTDDSRVVQVSVTPRTSFEVLIEVELPGSVIQWEYYVQKNDIGFGLSYRESQEELEEILPIYRLDTPDGTEKGSQKCQSKGTYVIIFNNEYSWFYTKQVSYCISVIEPEQ